MAVPGTHRRIASLPSPTAASPHCPVAPPQHLPAAAPPSRSAAASRIAALPRHPTAGLPSHSAAPPSRSATAPPSRPTAQPHITPSQHRPTAARSRSSHKCAAELRQIGTFLLDFCCTFVSRSAVGLLLHIRFSVRDRTPAAHSFLGPRSDSCCTFVYRSAVELLLHIRFSVRDMNSVISLPVTAPVFFFIPTPSRPPPQSLHLPVPHPNPYAFPSPTPISTPPRPPSHRPPPVIRKLPLRASAPTATVSSIRAQRSDHKDQRGGRIKRGDYSCWL